MKENGAKALYEVKVGLGFPVRATVVISRNGETLYADNSLRNPRGIQI